MLVVAPAEVGNHPKHRGLVERHDHQHDDRDHQIDGQQNESRKQEQQQLQPADAMQECEYTNPPGGSCRRLQELLALAVSFRLLALYGHGQVASPASPFVIRLRSCGTAELARSFGMTSVTRDVQWIKTGVSTGKNDGAQTSV